mgnify:CR=1 FL=1
MRTQQPARQGWRVVAALVLIAVAFAVLLQEAVAGALARWLAGVWIGAVDIIMRILGAPLAQLFG